MPLIRGVLFSLGWLVFIGTLLIVKNTWLPGRVWTMGVAEHIGLALVTFSFFCSVWILTNIRRNQRKTDEYRLSGFTLLVVRVLFSLFLAGCVLLLILCSSALSNWITQMLTWKQETGLVFLQLAGIACTAFLALTGIASNDVVEQLVYAKTRFKREQTSEPKVDPFAESLSQKNVDLDEKFILQLREYRNE